MARFTPFHTVFRSTVGERNDLSVPKGAPVRGSLYDADAFGRFSEALRSEERRVGKECRSRWSPYH